MDQLDQPMPSAENLNSAQMLHRETFPALRLNRPSAAAEVVGGEHGYQAADVTIESKERKCQTTLAQLATFGATSTHRAHRRERDARSVFGPVGGGFIFVAAQTAATSVAATVHRGGTLASTLRRPDIG